MKSSDERTYSSEDVLEKLAKQGADELEKAGESFNIKVPTRKDRSKIVPVFTGDRVKDEIAYDAVLKEIAYYVASTLIKDTDKKVWSPKNTQELSQNMLAELSVFKMNHSKELNSFIDKHSKIYRKGAPGFHSTDKLEIDDTKSEKEYNEDRVLASHKIRENVKKDLDSKSSLLRDHLDHVHSYLSGKRIQFVKTVKHSQNANDKDISR
jgi:hypothetical protein